MPSAIIREVHCLRCGHDWYPTRPGRPRRCPECGDPRWDKPRRWERPDLKRRQHVEGQVDVGAILHRIHRGKKKSQ